MTSSVPNYLPKSPFPNTITLGVRGSKYEFCENSNIKSITEMEGDFVFLKENYIICLTFIKKWILDTLLRTDKKRQEHGGGMMGPWIKVVAQGSIPIKMCIFLRSRFFL